MKAEALQHESGWLKRAFAINPFFVSSALMILVGMTLVLRDEVFFLTNESSLSFCLVSVELYQTCLVLTAIYLARRLVHRDSLLLVVLDFVFMVIPFILLTPACQSGDSLDQTAAAQTAARVAAGTAVIAVGMAIYRTWLLLKAYPGFKLNSAVLTAMGGLLVFNLVLPLLFYFPFDQESQYTIDGRYQLFEGVMLLVLPFLALCLNCLPRPVSKTESPSSPPWIPFTAVGILVFMSLFHMIWLWFTYAVEVPLSPAVFLPLAWVLAWTVWNRCADMVVDGLAAWRYRLHLVPFLTVIFLFFDTTREVALWLVAGNAALYGGMALTGRYEMSAKRLALASFVGLLLSRASGINPTVPATLSVNNPVNMVLWGIAALLILVPKPVCGIIGAAAFAALAHRLQGGGVTSFLPAYATFFGALYGHSCFWRFKDKEFASAVRIVLSGLVCLGTYVAARSPWGAFAYQLGILAVLIGLSGWYYLKRHAHEYFIPLTVLGFGALSLPGRGIYLLAEQQAFGPLAILSAFTLFATGVVVALRKRPIASKS